MIKNLIFDWSGTISDDLVPVHKATMHVFRAHQISEISYQEFKREFCYPYMGFYQKYSSAITKEDADLIFHEVIHHVGEPSPYPAAIETIKALHQSGLRLVIMSGVPQAKLVKEVRDYGLEKLFLEINGSVYDKTLKISGLLERNNFEPAQTLFIGDMAHDMHAGKVGKLGTVALCWGYEAMQPLLASKPDKVIDRIDLLPEIVSSWSY